MIDFELKGIVNDVPESVVSQKEFHLLVDQMPRWVRALGDCCGLDSLRVCTCEGQGQGDKGAW